VKIFTTVWYDPIYASVATNDCACEVINQMADEFGHRLKMPDTDAVVNVQKNALRGSGRPKISGVPIKLRFGSHHVSPLSSPSLSAERKFADR
jgi:hypothetical protein